MGLSAGQRLGPYVIVGPLGAGGMGEVYRATDTKLDREVAVKVLPAELAQDAERLARFEREAKLLASLNHPNIAHVYGFETATLADGSATHFLAMELVEGEDLKDRLARGPIPVDEALEVAKQVAEALEEAHEHGIVHRDLKPANVKLTADGKVKVLDFGLARAYAGDSGTGSGPYLSQSPTLAQTGTQAGVILGTAAYMSPEQARGKAVDKRSDIWAFGVLLFEMLTGRQLFAGETVSDVLAGVLKTEVDLGALPPSTPPAVNRLLRGCLERNPRNRLHDIADARIVLDRLVAGEREEVTATPAGGTRAPAWRRGLPWIVAGLGLLVAAASWLVSLGVTAAPGGSIELALLPPAGAELTFGSDLGWGVVSPDGRQVVFPATADGKRSLWVRPIDRAEAQPLPGTESGFYPFWSPDSRWMAFFTPGSLMKIEVAGGLPERICDAQQGRGGSWGRSGWMVFTPVGGGAISRVRAEGGEPVPVTELDAAAGEDAHYWPVWLPGETSFLYFIRSGRHENQGIYLGRVVEGDVDRTRRRVVATSASGLFTPTGRDRPPMLLWAQEGRLLARAVDPENGTLAGAGAEIARGVRVLESQRATMASISTTGTLVFASSEVGRRRIESFDRRGRSLGPLPIPPGAIYQLHVSPDGARLAYLIVKEGQGDIWVHDLASGSSRALTTSAEYENQPIWSPDGAEILYIVEKGTTFTVMRTRADGQTAPQRQPIGSEASGSRVHAPEVWLAEDWAIGLAQGPEEQSITAIRLGDGSEGESLPGRIAGRFLGYSKEAKALSYVSDESGTAQGFVVSIDVTADGVRFGGDRQRLPVDGARSIRWRQDGQELYAVAADGALWAVPVERRGDALRLGTAGRLFGGSFVDEDFGVYDDGERFLFLVDPEAGHQTLGIVLNWPARLEAAAR